MCYRHQKKLLKSRQETQTEETGRVTTPHSRWSNNNITRLHRTHEMRNLAIDVSGVCKSVSLSVCHTALRDFAVQKRLNGSRFSLGCRRLGAQRTLY